MRNADMPAAAQSFAMIDGEAGNTMTHLTTDEVKISMGLTKREAMAMHFMAAWIGHHGASKGHSRAYIYADKEAAESAVRSADALLAEFEKCGK